MPILNETDILVRLIGQKFQQLMIPKEGPMSFHQYYFLKYLERKKACTPSEIADQFGITLGAVSGFIDRIYKLNLITRIRSEEDRRQVIIRLSEEGKNQLKIFEKRSVEINRQILEKLGQEEIEVLNQHLARFRQVLDEISGV
ncbi:MarR family winged helix-turn-helix transcriptional regulator [Desulfitobacterium sp. AusDCA]|uniref:MarR family winged helix-turn-helix transcriptional regulator n=1 Tax=Desulfitobacterium sp. AusDCA TaxID=3240383 RepID=UPI003DA796F1